MEIKLNFNKNKSKNNNNQTFPNDIEFRDVKGFENDYEVSNYGHVRSKERILICKNGSKKFIPSKILSQADNGKGYKFINLWKNNKQHRYYIHRLVAETFIPNNDNLLEINHIDRNTSNNKVSNLEWCSRLTNERHKLKHISGYAPKKLN